MPVPSLGIVTVTHHHVIKYQKRSTCHYVAVINYPAGRAARSASQASSSCTNPSHKGVCMWIAGVFWLGCGCLDGSGEHPRTTCRVETRRGCRGGSCADVAISSTDGPNDFCSTPRRAGRIDVDGWLMGDVSVVLHLSHGECNFSI